MPFIDVINKAQDMFEMINDVEQFNTGFGEEHRFIILDPNERFVTIEKTINRHINDANNITVYHIVSADNFSDATMLCDRGKLCISLITDAQNNSLMEIMVEKLYSEINTRWKETRDIAQLYLQINVYQIFDVKDIGENCVNQAKTLAPILSYFSKDESKKTNFFPLIRVLNVALTEREFEIKQNILAEQIYYIHMADHLDEVIKNYNISDFSDTDYPWLSFVLVETFSPEILFFRWILNGFNESMNATIDHIISKIDTSYDSVKTEFLKLIEYESFAEVYDDFSECLGYVPVSIEEKEWHRDTDYVDKVEKEKKEKKVFFGLIKKIESVDVPHQVFIGTDINEDYEVLKITFVSYIKQKVSQDDMCYIILSQLYEIKRNLSNNEYEELNETLKKCVKEIFSIEDDKYGVWTMLLQYYLKGFENTDRIKKCYERVVNTFNRTVRMIENQIRAWSNMTAPPYDIVFNQFRIKASRNIEIIYKQLIKNIGDLQKSAEFKEEFKKKMDCIDNTSPDFDRINLCHMLVSEEYIEKNQTEKETRLNFNTKLKGRSCFYMLCDGLNNMVQDRR